MDSINPNERTFSLVMAFLKHYEEKCVLLCSHVRRKSEKIYVIVKNKKNKADIGEKVPGSFVTSDGTAIKFKENKLEVLSLADKIPEGSNILGIIYVDNTLFHCIPAPNQFTKKDCSTLLDFINKIMEGGKIKCISGDSEGTSFLGDLLKVEDKIPYQVNNYKLMSICNFNNGAEKDNEKENMLFVPEPLSNDDKIIRCTENEIDELFSIQKKYLKDEVAPYGKKVSDMEVKMTLRHILKNQLCLAVFSDGNAVAKANTNAIGINWIQIGGVYTHPLYRRNGYALNLIYTICRRAVKVNKCVSLFVKDINVPAMELYKKIGFKETGTYKILYY